MNAGDPLEWYMDIPVVSRAYLTLSFLTTAACALDLVSPFSLYFNYKLIVEKAQVRVCSLSPRRSRCLRTARPSPPLLVYLDRSAPLLRVW